MGNKIKDDYYDLFIASMAKVNPTTLIGKSYNEIISEGLKVFQIFPGFYSVSLFLLDVNDSTFYHKTALPDLKELEMKVIFQLLIENGFIAQALSNANIVIIDNIDNSSFQHKKIILPLITYTGIIGIIIILMNASTSITNEIEHFCKIQANYLALLINNKEQLSEIENLKEITDQKIASSTKDIVKSTLELKIILDSVETGIIIVDNKSELIIEANGLAVNLIGTDKSKIINSRIDSFFLYTNPKTRKNLFNSNQEGLLKKYSGKLVPIIKSVAHVTIEDQEYRIESFLDITERKEMEYALEKARFELEQKVEERTIELYNSNKELQKEIDERRKAEDDLLKLYWAVEQSPYSIFITDKNGQVEYVNHCFHDSTGYKFEEIVGSTTNKFRSDDKMNEGFNSILENVLAGVEWKGEFKNKKKNGELYWVSSSISPIRNFQGEITHLLEIQEDITNKKLALEELLVAKDKAEESEKIKTAILANMSHELRTPLIGILGFSQMLKEDILDPIKNKIVDNIYLSGLRLQNTVDDILFITRFDGSDIIFNYAKTDLAEIINDLKAKHINKATEKGLDFNLKILSNNFHSILDSELIDQAMSKIVDNAIKFTNSGSVTIILDSEIKDGKNWITIKVVDTGIGIDKNNYGILFEAFRQQSEGFFRNYEGCGLGLTIAKMIITSMNGFITVESIINKGSAFTVWLPSIEQNN